MGAREGAGEGQAQGLVMGPRKGDDGREGRTAPDLGDRGSGGRHSRAIGVRSVSSSLTDGTFLPEDAAPSRSRRGEAARQQERPGAA